MKKYGVLLVNLGTPDKAEKKSVSAYLREFLMDKHVLDIPFPIRFFLVNFIIVPKRLSAVTELYQSIWQEDSPIRSILYKQASALESVLNESDKSKFFVQAAMTYGKPSIKQALEALIEQQVDEIITLPLYPQYSKTTTLPVLERFEKAKQALQCELKSHFVAHYYEHEAYIGALREQIIERWQSKGVKPDLLLLSYHGIPVSYVEKGDPYYEHCQKTTLALKKSLSAYEVPIVESFQSRVTAQEWLQPYTEEKILSCPKEGVKHLEVCCPGFSADCLETIEEVGIEYRKLFMEKGGESYHVFPALNERQSHINLMASLVKQALLV